jgi:hypothetical protein
MPERNLRQVRTTICHGCVVTPDLAAATSKAAVFAVVYTKPLTEDWIHYRRDSNIPPSIPQMALPQLAFILGTLGVFVVYWRSGQRQQRHLPPGPRKLPVIGNLFSMPTRAEWETFTKWGKEYSLWLIPRTIFISYLAQTPTLFTSTL